MSFAPASPPPGPDILDWGPRRRGPSRTQRLIITVTALVAVTASLIAWWVSTRPWLANYSHDQVAAAYLPAGWGRNTLPWMTSTIETSPTGRDSNLTTEPQQCRDLIIPPVDPGGQDSVRAELSPSSASDDSGVVQTRRYSTLSAARAGYQATIDTIHACATFTASDYGLTATVTEQRHRLGRSDTSFTITGSDGSNAEDTTVTLRSTITRYANTITWVITATDATTNQNVTKRISNQIIDQLQAAPKEAARQR